MQTMTMAAELRLPQTMSIEDKKAYVTRLMDVLGLTKVSRFLSLCLQYQNTDEKVWLQHSIKRAGLLICSKANYEL